MQQADKKAAHPVDSLATALARVVICIREGQRDPAAKYFLTTIKVLPFLQWHNCKTTSPFAKDYGSAARVNKRRVSVRQEGTSLKRCPEAAPQRVHFKESRAVGGSNRSQTSDAVKIYRHNMLPNEVSARSNGNISEKPEKEALRYALALNATCSRDSWNLATGFAALPPYDLASCLQTD
uniref:Serine/threonine-protein kinase ATR n=1 Tax=Steinernema glaseri TaxID=37863 RepID=A0A1I7ZTB6_9BILA